MKTFLCIISLVSLNACLTLDGELDNLDVESREQALQTCTATCDYPTYNGVPVSCSSSIYCVAHANGVYCDTGGTPITKTCSSSGIPTTGLHLWLRADAGVTVSAGRVSEWRDQSGNGRHGTMATLSRQPYLMTGALNGLPVLRFAGAQSLHLSSSAQPTTFTVFVVGKNSKSSESFSMILGPSNNSPNNQLRWENGSQVLFVGIGNNMPTITSTVGNTRAYHALSVRYDGSSMSVYRDGNLASSHAFSTSGPWTLASLGSWYSTYFMEGDLAEVIVYDRVLSESERSTVNGYLRSKYNLP